MDALILLLESYGNWGMFIAAFIAGSFLPWSSEAIMLAMLAAGLDAQTEPLPGPGRQTRSR